MMQGFMQKQQFDRIIEDASRDWASVVKGALLEVGCTDPEDVKVEQRHIVTSFIERRLPEDNFSVYRNSFDEGYGYLQRGSFDSEKFGVIKEKYGYEERGKSGQ